MGSFFALGAPFRAKISPIGAEGVPLIVTGTVFSLETKKALPFAVLDIWQASGEEAEKGGVYDYHETGPERRPYSESVNTVGKTKNYNFRGRVICNENGQYEFETITPQPYLDDQYEDPPGVWRCAHIHYYVNSPGYTPLVTQVYFENHIVTPGGYEDKHAAKAESLYVKLEEKVIPKKKGDFKYNTAKFDLVMQSTA